MVSFELTSELINGMDGSLEETVQGENNWNQFYPPAFLKRYMGNDI